MTPALALAAAYLIGAIPVGYLVARAAGLGDIRSHGSGTIGTTNVLRTLGRGPAVVTLLGDVVKGYLAVTVGTLIAGGEPFATAGAAVAAVAGNCWPVFLRFRGGKGVATGLGAMLRLVPGPTCVAAVVWVVVAGLSRYASLASLVAVVSIPIAVMVVAAVAGGPIDGGQALGALVAAIVVAGIVVVRHRENIARLRSGTERRLGHRSTS